MTRSKSFLGTILFAVAFVAVASTMQTDKEKEAAAARQRVEEALTKLAKDGGDWEKFSLTYSDLHAFHGGLTLTINGTGKVTQKAVHQKVGEEQDVSEKELKRLVELLQSHKAWEQKEPPRRAIPDESTAGLVIRYGGDVVEIWEWHNDLAKNKRILEIREAMKKAAWIPDNVAPPPRKVEP